MNAHKDTNPNHLPAVPPRSRRRWALAAVLAVAVGAVGAVSTSVASGGPSLHGQHGPMAMSPAAMEAHIDKMVEECAAEASSDQKARLAAIAKTAVAELRPVHQQFREAHAQAHTLLMAPTIDRAALEQWRAVQMQRMDDISRRVVAAVEDGAEVLTPEQRAACAGRLRQRMH